jgi:hypothetical protein
MFINDYTRTILRLEENKLEKTVKYFNVVSPSFFRMMRLKLPISKEEIVCGL